MICLFCKKEFSSLKGIHSHIKSEHKCAQADYYQLHYPRYDIGDNSAIYYKDYDQYFSTDFNSRDSLVAWASDLNSKEKVDNVKNYCIKKLVERKNLKSLKFFPSHVELKSLLIPSIFGLSKIWNGNLNDIFDKTLLIPRFSYNYNLSFDQSDYDVYIDTREQSPLNFYKYKMLKLSVGDYTPSAPLFCELFVERKSLNDLAGTLTSGYERFRREIDRAVSLDSYLVVVVESSFSDVMGYSPSISFSKKVNGAFLMHRIRELMQRYDNIQFLFCGTRGMSRDCIDKIFRLKDSAKFLDLEYLKDKGDI